MKKFENKVVLLSGGTSGLGKELLMQFSSEGASVVFNGRREKEGRELETKISSIGRNAYFFKADISRENEVSNLVDFAMQKYGKIDILINNAGVIGKNSLITNYSSQDFDDVFQVNVKGVWHTMKYVIPEMLKQKKGSIVNVSSVSGLIGFPFNSFYSASKHAVIGITKSAALEFGHKGIRINAVCPGGIKTEMLEGIFQSTGKADVAMENMIKLHSLRRLADPSEIASTILFLASDDSSFVHGAAIPVDGGWTTA
jgi:NAD(P)-dependent dehydrogenase (short-subunit alcohol dehydrogenase family)